MSASVVGQYDSIQQGGRFVTTRGSTARSPASAERSGSVTGRDAVDLGNISAIDQAFKMLNRQDTVPIPESVGRAIRALIQEVLNQLPGTGRKGFY
ncbi:MAG: hypothetical protein H7838_01130 [Magnetococcus sp. DMHC-8]